MNIDELATYRVRPMLDVNEGLGDPVDVPLFEIVHSICNRVVHAHYVSVSLVEMVQRALDHSKQCDP